MASISRSMALRHALRTATRQPATRPKHTTLASPLRLFQVPRAAAFHASVRKAILPPLPQTIKGTVNDPVEVHDPEPTHGSYHWTFERALSLGLVPLTVAPFIGGSLSPIMDSILCATLVLHSHIGFDACITDYFPTYRTPGLQKFLNWVLRGATVLVGVGLYQFETNDIGLTAAIAKIWTA